jgi:Transglycosylase SLT domain
MILCVNILLMRQFLCLLLLLMPGLAMAAQDTGPRRAAAGLGIPLPMASRPMAPAIGGRGPGGHAPGGGAAGSSGTIAPDPAALCETAVAAAEADGRLPPRLLHAISLVESGRADARIGTVRAWPWTINAEGEGRFYATRQQAVAAAEALQARGVQSIDVGCMQVNLMYHPHAFATLQDAFDPHRNAAYAARFLNTLFAEAQDWSHAIGAYHSETLALGEAYRALVTARWQSPDLRPAPQGQQVARQQVARQQVAYGAFARADAVYGAFRSADRTYGAFAARPYTTRSQTD